MNHRELPTSSSPSRSDRLTRMLVRRAARRAPPLLAERLEEEWLADLQARDAGLAKLRFAIGCAWASRVIVGELGAQLSAADGAGGGIVLPAEEKFLSRRTATLVLVMGLHAAVFFGLLTVGTRLLKPKPTPPFQTHWIDPVPRTPQPLVVAPRMTREQILVDRPPPTVVVPDSPAVTADEATAQPPSRSAPPAPPRQVPQSVVGGPGARFPETSGYYPDASRRAGEEGLVQVTVCVQPDGHLRADPTLAHSSSIKRLDEAALRLAKAASGHYRPTTEDGRPLYACFPIGIRFKMQNSRY